MRTLSTLAFLLACAPAFAQPFAETDRLFLGSQSQEDFFGWSVDISGDYAIIGAPQTAAVPRLGAAYIYQRGTDGAWTLAQPLTSGNTDPNVRDKFGASVAIDGDLAVVLAAPDPPSGKSVGNGEAFVYRRNGIGDWVLDTRLEARGANWFRDNIALSGNTVAVATAEGQFAVYTRGGTGWSLEATLAVDSGARVFSAALSGDRLVAYEGFNAFVFTRSGTTWTQEAMLTPGPLVGISAAAIDGDRLALIGFNGTTDDSEPGPTGAPTPGVAYVYDRTSGGAWDLTVSLVPRGAEGGRPGFGSAADLDGDVLAVGAMDEGPLTFLGLPDERGAAFVYERDGAGMWAQTVKLRASDAGEGEEFGFDVAVDAGRILAGAIRGDGPFQGRGAAYVFGSTNDTAAEPEASGAMSLALAPNPASGATTVTVNLAAPEAVRVAVYSVLGREVAVLHDGPLASGAHALGFDARGTASGLYVVRLATESGVVTKRLSIVR